MFEDVRSGEIPVILYQDEDILVLQKPAGWFVYPPDYKYKGRTPILPTVTKWLFEHCDLRAYPAHRLDAATEGVMIFGLTKEATADLNHQFKTRQVKKNYFAAIRGWMPEKDGRIEKPLPIASTNEIAESITEYRTLTQIELPHQVNSPHPTSRYAWLEVSPLTGRWHQIRRHFDMCAHPLVGDREHGDSHHNRFFRDQLGINGLCLFAAGLHLSHPRTKKQLALTGLKTERLKKLQELFLKSGI